MINELDSTITMFDYESESGTLLEQQTLSTLPGGFNGTTHCADLKITPDGRFLYGTNRGHDSIAAYTIADDGRLTLIDIILSDTENPKIWPSLPTVDCYSVPIWRVAALRSFASIIRPDRLRQLLSRYPSRCHHV